MKEEQIFHILGISRTKDENQIKEAYRRLLKETNPEEHPEEFKKLRQAYEGALIYARTQEEEEGPKNEVDRWLEEVEDYYNHILWRADLAGWKKLLENAVCMDLDTALEAREKLLLYLSEHFRIPHMVWKLIDDTFDILENMGELRRTFSNEFLDYVQYYTLHETFLPYELLTYRNGEIEENGDEYVRDLLQLKRQLDNGELEGLEKQYEQLCTWPIYHPYEKVEYLRLLLEQERAEQGKEMTEALLQAYPQDHYVLLYTGKVKWELGEKEEAYALWKRILEQYPNHYSAKLCTIKYLIEKQEYEEAKMTALELMEPDRWDERVEEILEEINALLIEKYQKELEQEEAPSWMEETRIDLGWCLLQNKRLAEAKEILEVLEGSLGEDYQFCNLYGRLLYRMEAHEKALSYLRKWRDLICSLEEDGTQETRERKQKRGTAAYLLGGCCYALEEIEEAEEWVREAIAYEESWSRKQDYTRYLANIFLWSKQYEKSVDVCDELLQKDSGYYPAYLIRQEAFFEMGKDQEVIHDYHNAVQIYPGYYQPYLLAVEVFFYHGQYEDARNVIQRAKENEVSFSPKMKLFEVRVIRNLAEGSKERRAARTMLEEIRTELDQEDCDIEDASEIEYETGLLYWDDSRLREALKYLKKAIEMNGERLQYRLIRGHVYLQAKKSKKALEEYQAAEAGYPKAPELYYNRGRCYENLGRMERAIEEYEKVLNIQEDYRNTLEKLSDYYNDKFQEEWKPEYYEKALFYINRQLAMRENSYYLVCRALIYDRAMETEKAIADYEKALELAPKDCIIWSDLGCSYKAICQFEKAISYFEKAFEVMEDDEKKRLPYQNIAECYTALDQYEEAAEWYQKALKIWPEYAFFWEKLGDAYTDMEEYDKALEAYQHSLNRDEAYSNMGYVWMRRGDIQKCIEVHEEGIEEAEGEQKAKRYCLLGNVYLEKLQEYDKALECLCKAAAMQKNPDEKYKTEESIARTYYMMKNQKQAKKHAALAIRAICRYGRTLEDYLAYKAYAPARHATMGWLYLSMGETQKAVEYFKKMEELQPCKACSYGKCFESSLYLGLLYESLGEYDKALELLEEALRRNPDFLETIYAIERLQNRQNS